MSKKTLSTAFTLVLLSGCADQNPADPVIINGKTVDPLYGWSMCHPFNMLGRLPVLSVPSGIGGNGLPTSVQIVARHLDDERVLRGA